MGNTEWIRKFRLPYWILGLLALILILRIPSFFEPYYYGDEMVYLTLGTGVRQGLTLYKDIHDNKPPLLYLMAAGAGSLFWFKVILAFWMLATTVIFYKLARKLFPENQNTQKVSTVIFAALTTLPLLEGNTANSELFMIVFTIFAFLILLKEKLSGRFVFLAGFLMGLGTLFKIPAAFDAPIIVIYWLITSDLKSDWKKILTNTVVLIAGFATPLILTFVWYFTKGALTDYIKAAFLQNVGYLSSFRPGDVQKPFLVRNTPLLMRAGFVILGSGVLFIFRKRLSKRFILLSLWILLTLFAITLSERPYPHYFIQAAAPIAFLFGLLFTEKSFEQSLVILPLTLTFFVPIYYKFYVYPTTPYYLRFLNFTSGNINRSEYFNSFDVNTVRNYKIAEFLVTASVPSDRVFVWDPAAPTIYALARRLPGVKYVVPYHVHDYSNPGDTAKQIIANPPKFIIETSGNPYPELSALIKTKYLLIQQIENANIYVRIDKGL